MLSHKLRLFLKPSTLRQGSHLFHLRDFHFTPFAIGPYFYWLRYSGFPPLFSFVEAPFLGIVVGDSSSTYLSYDLGLRQDAFLRIIHCCISNFLIIHNLVSQLLQHGALGNQRKLSVCISIYFYTLLAKRPASSSNKALEVLVPYCLSLSIISW